MGALEAERTRYDARSAHLAAPSEVCQRLPRVEGVGPLTVTAFIAAMHAPRVFQHGRHGAAWLGLVPRQHGTGGKTVLGGVSKRGNAYLRRLLLQGALAVLRRVEGKTDRRSVWLPQLRARRGTPIAALALANKHARILWAFLATGDGSRHTASRTPREAGSRREEGRSTIAMPVIPTRDCTGDDDMRASQVSPASPHPAFARAPLRPPF
jgi:transposase